MSSPIGSIPRALMSAMAGGRPAFSFEFFPPKDDAGEELLWEAIHRLERVNPAFVSVTYGAGGSTQDRTVRMTERIATETDLRPLAHLTCVGADVEQLRGVIGQYAAAGVGDILALRGDPPGDPGGAWRSHPGGLDHAEQLVDLIGSLGEFTVGVAAFPDRHPESAHEREDIETLVRKYEAGAQFAVTQMVFDVDTYLRMRDALAERCPMPVTPGLMPVQSLPQVTRMSQLMGTPLPPTVVERLHAHADDPMGLKSEGITIATEIASRLLAEGAPGIHFITMNRSTATLQVYENLSAA